TNAFESCRAKGRSIEAWRERTIFRTTGCPGGRLIPVRSDREGNQEYDRKLCNTSAVGTLAQWPLDVRSWEWNGRPVAMSEWPRIDAPPSPDCQPSREASSALPAISSARQHRTACPSGRV